MSDAGIARIFTDRPEAGRLLAERLQLFRSADPVVIGLTRGGVPVASEVARTLQAPLEVIAVTPLSLPGQEEHRIGAIAEDGTRFVMRRALAQGPVGAREVLGIERRARTRLDRQVARLRSGQAARMLGGRTVIIVDDGLVTGSSARVACAVARGRGATRVVVALPVAAPAGLPAVAELADDIVTIQTVDDVISVGRWYADFRQTGDEEVRSLLTVRPGQTGPMPVFAGSASAAPAREVSVPVASDPLLRVPAVVACPRQASMLIICPHASSRTRFSARQGLIAAILNNAGLATAQVDLLSAGEELAAGAVPHVARLTDRLRAVTRSLGEGFGAVGYLAAGPVSAAALRAASAEDSRVTSVVCLSGRPDLARPFGPRNVRTLLLAGAEDSVSRRLLRDVLENSGRDYELTTIRDADDLLRDPESLVRAAERARDWFRSPVDRPVDVPPTLPQPVLPKPSVPPPVPAGQPESRVKAVPVLSAVR
jgi:putative phosphoribosyl transferase